MTHACAVPYTQDTAQKRAPQFGGLPGACRADRNEDAGTDEVRYVVVEVNQLLLLRSPLGISRPRSGPTKVGTDHGQGDTQGRCHAGQRHRRSFGPLGRKLVPRCRWWRWTRPGPNAPDHALFVHLIRTRATVRHLYVPKGRYGGKQLGWGL